MSEFETGDGPGPQGETGRAALAAGAGLLALVAGGAVAFGLLRGTATPAPAEIARDPLLARGREIYLDRCVSCHGVSGKGDGPIARGLKGPPVGNLTDASWKHGDTPEAVQTVVRQGVTDTAMPGWGATLGPDGVRAVSAYVFHLAGRRVPAALRVP